MENQIFKAMALIMKAVDPIKKAKTNSQGPSFKYRGIDDVMNALHEAFADNQVFLTTEVLSRSEVERQSKSGGALFYVTLNVKFTFHAPDGSNISSIISGTAMDSGDKADNKAMSIALKYCLLQAFLIPTEDLDDPDAITHEVKHEEQKPPNPETPVQKTYANDNRPWMTEKQLREVINRINGGEISAGETAIKAFKMKKTYKEEINKAVEFSKQFDKEEAPF